MQATNSLVAVHIVINMCVRCPLIGVSRVLLNVLCDDAPISPSGFCPVVMWWFRWRCGCVFVVGCCSCGIFFSQCADFCGHLL